MAPFTFFWGDIMNTQATHWTDMNRAFLEPLNRWNELAARNAEKMTQYGLALAKDLMEMGTSQLQLTNELKDPQKWMAAETKLMTEYSQKMTDRSGEYLTLTTEIRESVWKWGEDTAKATTEAVQPKAN
ncbi:MAG: phasin family protein [Methylococcus sp.]